MNIEIPILGYIITFLFVFAIISLFRLLFKFISALLSTPPEKFVMGNNALIYYGICLSFLITVLFNIIT
jgi:hypothetical protein